jgi:CBS domain containing-hemolysin-like protein
MLEVLAILAVVILLTAYNALSVAAEYSTVGSRRTKIKELAERGNRSARLLLPVLQDGRTIDRYIAATQIGITLSHLVVGLYAQAELVSVLSPQLALLGGLQEVAAQALSVTIVLLVLTIFQAVLGELLPKGISLRYPESVALFVTLPMRGVVWLLRPFITLLNGSAFVIMRLFRLPSASEGIHVHTPEELALLFHESAQGGLIDVEEREMLQNVFRLETLVARQLMVPRSRMKAVDVGSEPAELFAELKRLPHTRFPVYEGSIDKIVGMIHLKDLFWLVQEEPQGDVREIVREISLLPETVPANELWQTLRASGSHMVLLFNEYGGTAGLITLEDIIEEVFGELQDEFDRETDLIRRDDEGRVYLRGDLLIVHANERLALDLPDDDADTIGGLVLAALGRAPEVGDETEIAGLRWHVEAVKGHAVTEASLALSEGHHTADLTETPAEEESS